MADPGHHPFASKAQWRYFFANPRLKRWSHEKAHETQRKRGGPKLAFRSLPGHSSLAGKLGVGRTKLRAKNRR